MKTTIWHVFPMRCVPLQSFKQQFCCTEDDVGTFMESVCQTMFIPAGDLGCLESEMRRLVELQSKLKYFGETDIEAQQALTLIREDVTALVTAPQTCHYKVAPVIMTHVLLYAYQSDSAYVGKWPIVIVVKIIFMHTPKF